MDAGEGKIGDLERAEILVRIAGRHEEGFVDLKTPGAALDGAVGWEAGEVSIEITSSARHWLRIKIMESVPIHRKLHFGFIVRDWAVYLFELLTELGIDIPAERRAEETGTEVVHAILGIAQHDSEVLRHVLEQDMQRMHVFYDGLLAQDAIMEDIPF